MKELEMKILMMKRWMKRWMEKRVKKVSTGIIVFPDGTHQEFSDFTHRYSEVFMGKMFLCNSDFLLFGSTYTELKADEYLEIGQIYFALPKTWLNKKIESVEMQTLANRANLVMMKVKATIHISGYSAVTFTRSNPYYKM